MKKNNCSLNPFCSHWGHSCLFSKSVKSEMTMYLIRDLVWESQLTKRTCHKCRQLFTELDCKEDNWEVRCRDLDWDDFAKKTSSGWLAIKLELEHSDCPKKTKNA